LDVLRDGGRTSGSSAGGRTHEVLVVVVVAIALSVVLPMTPA
jgi:hypothetical protein